LIAVLQIMSTLITVIMLPIQTRMYVILLKKGGSEGIPRTFRIFQSQIIALNILYSVFKLLLHDACFYGIAGDTFMSIGRSIAYADFSVDHSPVRDTREQAK
ncbi:hypothetical protein PENTCL1PPCAC_13504, partial [Pristionchus entomophagus]